LDTFSTRLIALIVFIGAALTDLYDGKIARRTGQVTVIGTFLDPLVDKMLILAALVGFVELRELHIPAWMVVLIMSREFLITGLRSLAASRGITMAAEKAGKFKTASQMTAIITILVFLVVEAACQNWPSIAPYFGGWIGVILDKLPYWLVLWATLATIVSGYMYIDKYRDLLKTEFSILKQRPTK
jgi:CDP-diacylglycerol--glycerol-3-phosphate 3-phosphatidyltransferase